MPSVITDNPAAIAAVTFIGAFLAVLTQFGVQLTQGQIGALLALFVAGLALFLILQKTMVPKTPSSTGSGTLQTPPPGTVLTTLAAAKDPAPIPPSSVIASTPADPPK